MTPVEFEVSEIGILSPEFRNGDLETLQQRNDGGEVDLNGALGDFPTGDYLPTPFDSTS